MKYNIEAYINNEMTADERQSFEAELSSNAQLQVEVEEMRVLIRDLRRISISKQVGIAQKRLLARKKIIRIGSVGLCLLVFLFLAGWFFFGKSPEDQPNPQKENLEQNFPPQKTPPELEEKQKKDSSTSPTKPIASVEKPSNASYFKQLALNAYEIPDDFLGIRGNLLDTLNDLFIQEKYDEGLFLLNQMATLDANQTYLYAHFLFKKGAFLKAQQQFYAMEMDPEMAPYKDKAQWFGLLAAIAQGEKAKKEVQRLHQLILSDANHEYRPEVLKLSKRIEFQKLVQ